MKIQSFLTQLCEHCGIAEEKISVEIEDLAEESIITLTVPEEDSGIFIGHHGEGIDSLQRIIRIIFQEKDTEIANKKITLNINNYREKREDRLKDLTYTIANKVLDSGQPYTFTSYLPAHERYVIHSTLSEEKEFSSLESVSEGTARDRKLTIRIRE